MNSCSCRARKSKMEYDALFAIDWSCVERSDMYNFIHNIIHMYTLYTIDNLSMISS